LPAAIRMSGVRKTFGPKVAVEGMDLEIPEGKLYGFIGPNGAGKTTSIRMIMGIIFPDSGELDVLGKRNAVESRDRVGYLPEERGVYKKMKVGQFLTYMGRLKGIDAGAGLRRRIDAWLERVQLADVSAKKCEELSKGMQQKVQFVASVLHEPELLILDEPFSGLDPVNARLLRSLIHEQHAEGRTVIFSTHVMASAEQICDHVVMIHNGRKMLDDSLASVRAGHDPRTILFEPLDPAADLSPIDALPGVRGRATTAGVTAIDLAEDADGPAVLRAVVERVPTSRIELRRPSLEDIFIGIVSSDAATADDLVRLRAGLRDDAAQPVLAAAAAGDGMEGQD